jgi:hypothetical protein
MTVTVYGGSDDLIEVEGDVRAEFTALEVLGGEEDFTGGFLAFSDGTLLKVSYQDAGIWRVTPVAKGHAVYEKTFEATDSESANYSDRVTLSGDIRWVVCGSDYSKAGR